MSVDLFSGFKLGHLELKNRVVMAPMTRNRAIDHLPNQLMATYYSQRAEAGLIITEGTSPSVNGIGYARIPGIYDQDQIKAWKNVTGAVHAAGSKIFLQLMHTGRVSHSVNMPSHAKILAPSAVKLEGAVFTDQQGMAPYPVPKEMTEGEILAAIQEYAQASVNAIKAGFDGVELHAANGYLIDQFLNTASNHRKDSWGGSPENRVRFALEVAKATASEIGAHRVGMRVSPYGAFNGTVSDSEIEKVYELLAQSLSKTNIVYMHTVDHSSMGAPEVKKSVKDKIRKNFSNALILSGGYSVQRAQVDLKEERGQLIAFGRAFISNPKLVSLMKAGKPPREADQSTFYTPGAKGYTDYSA